MTEVSVVVLRRQVTGEVFAGLTDAVWTCELVDTGAVFTFDADLDAATCEAIRLRLESRDDDDQAARGGLASLAAECDAWLAANPDDLSPGALALRAALALTRYTLNDQEGTP